MLFIYILSQLELIDRKKINRKKKLMKVIVIICILFATGNSADYFICLMKAKELANKYHA